MTVLLEKGRLRARQSMAPQDIQAAQMLRALAFGCDDRDALDALCSHILVEDIKTGTAVCCFRMLLLSAQDLDQCYSAQYYDLSSLAAFEGSMVEMGRFCTHPDFASDPDILRMAWGAMTAYVDANQVELLFGCSSFAGTDASAYQNSFLLLKERYIAPETFLPRVKAAQTIPFSKITNALLDAKQGMRNMPPLLRTYLMMGGWVSDHAVIDEKMKTLHVFTGVEIRTIPDVRKRLLRTVVGN